MTDESRPRAVLDTAALLSEDRHWLWSFAHDGFYEGVWSTYIVGEVARIRVEQAIARGVDRAVYRERINNLIHRLSDVLSVADYRIILLDGALGDPDDDPILAAALAGRAGFVVSHNTSDFPPGDQLMGVRFITPATFLGLLDALHPDVNIKRQAGEAGRQLP